MSSESWQMPPSSSYARSLPEPCQQPSALPQANREAEAHAIPTASWMGLNGFTLSEKSQVQKATDGVTLF